MNDIKFLRAYVGSADGQRTIRDWGEALRERIGNKDAYLAAVLASNEAAMSLDPSTILTKLLETVGENVTLMGPGHDAGHLRRDLLTALLVSEGVGGYLADKLAGLIAGAFHDVGNMLTPRYKDRTNNASHMYVSAWWLSIMAKDLVPEGILDVACYAVLAHGHYLVEIKSEYPDPFTLMPFWDDLFVDNGTLVGVAIRICRWADRADANGAQFVVRTMISKCDNSEEGGDDLSGTEWLKLSGDSVRAMMHPATTSPYAKTVTAIQHGMNFAKSNFNFGSPYAKDDYINPVFGELIRFKTQQVATVAMATNDLGIEPLDLSGIKSVITHISGARIERFDKAWAIFLIEWEGMTPENQLALGRVMKVISMEYAKLLAHFVTISTQTKYSALAQAMVAKLLMQ